MDTDVKVAASKFLTLAFAEARRQQIVPRPGRTGRWERVDGPWPPYWACYEIATDPITAQLVDTLRVAYPGRFGVESKFPYKDPTLYVCALLRAVIAESVVRESRLSSRSRAALSLMEELERVVSIDGQRFACLWVVSDVDFQAVDREVVGAVTLFEPRSPPEITVSMLMPEALWVGNGYPSPGARHGGLLYASGVGEGHHWDVTRPLNNGTARFLTALRLATGTTSRERVVWIGEPSMIHVEMPEAHPQRDDFMMESYWRRVAKVTPDQLDGLRDLTAMLDGLEVTGTKKTLPAVVIAMRRYSRSFRSGAWQDTVLDLATALEACLTPPKEEIGLILRTRAAHLLAHDDSEEAEAIYNDIADLYALRSDIIHGSAKLQKDLPTLWAARGYTQVLVDDRIHVLLDRWRDIVRRAITARLLLADDRIGPPKWPLVGKEVKVDLFLVRRDTRDEWRERIVAGAATYALPLLAESAPPLIDYLHTDR